MTQWNKHHTWYWTSDRSDEDKEWSTWHVTNTQEKQQDIHLTCVKQLCVCERENTDVQLLFNFDSLSLRSYINYKECPALKHLQFALNLLTFTVWWFQSSQRSGVCLFSLDSTDTHINKHNTVIKQMLKSQDHLTSVSRVFQSIIKCQEQCILGNIFKVKFCELLSCHTLLVCPK